MSLVDIFDDTEQAAVLEDLGELVRLHYPAQWPQPRSAYAIVEEGFVEDGAEYEVSRDVLTLDMLDSVLPQVSAQDLKQGLEIELCARDNRRVHVSDKRPIGAGAVQLIAELP